MIPVARRGRIETDVLHTYFPYLDPRRKTGKNRNTIERVVRWTSTDPRRKTGKNRNRVIGLLKFPEVIPVARRGRIETVLEIS